MTIRIKISEFKYMGMVTDPLYWDALARQKGLWREFYVERACQEVEESINKLARQNGNRVL